MSASERAAKVLASTLVSDNPETKRLGLEAFSKIYGLETEGKSARELAVGLLVIQGLEKMKTDEEAGMNMILPLLGIKPEKETSVEKESDPTEREDDGKPTEREDDEGDGEPVATCPL